MNIEELEKLSVYSSYVEDDSYVDNEYQAVESLKYKIGDAIVKRYGYYVLDGLSADSVRTMTVCLIVKNVMAGGIHKAVEDK